MRSMLRNVVAALMCFLGFTLLAYGQTKSLEERLQELEARLKSLEEAQKPKTAADAAAPAASDSQTVELQELRRQLNVIAAEMEKMRSGEADIEVSPQQATSLGLGPSAATVYRKRHGVSIAGYGEMLYLNPARKNESGVVRNTATQLDFLRAILYAGYRFNDKFLFNSEIEFEHANTAKGGGGFGRVRLSRLHGQPASEFARRPASRAHGIDQRISRADGVSRRAAE